MSPAASKPAPTALEHAFVVTLAGGPPIGAFLELSGLGVQIAVHEYAEGGANYGTWKLPGRVTHSNVTLRRGVTNQAIFFDWANSTSIESRDVLLFFVGPDRRALHKFALTAAYPASWSGPSANIGASSAATESLEIAHHGIVRVGGYQSVPGV
ncbi:MAG: phage tail protein [Patulibacter minatonensis]